MATERLRYVEKRPNKRKPPRWYWRRRGFDTQRLPDDPVARYEMIRDLNAAADGRRKLDGAAAGSVQWVVNKYKNSDRWHKLAPGTQRAYIRWLDEICQIWGRCSIVGMTRRVVVDYIDSLDGKPQKLHAAAVLQNVFEVARYYALIPSNPAHKLRLAKPGRRDAVWTTANVGAFLEACAGHRNGQAMALAFHILYFTAQRPGDVLSKKPSPGMTWSQYNGETIKLRQEKTGKLIEVPCHKDLRAILDAAKAEAQSPSMVVKTNGRPLPYDAFRANFRKVRAAAGLDQLQARDLRRTAMVRMAEAGATNRQISAVSGHSIERTSQILEHYIPANLEMAQAAIHKLEVKGE